MIGVPVIAHAHGKMKYYTDQKSTIGSAIFQEYKLASQDCHEGFQDMRSSRRIPGQDKTLNGLLPEGILHGSHFSISCRMCFFGPIDGWWRDRRRRRPARSAWEGDVSVLCGTTSGTRRLQHPTPTVMTLTILEGLGPNYWWLCVRINWLAMDFLDHRTRREQSTTPTILESLTVRPRQEYHLPYQSSSSARPMPPCCWDGKLLASGEKREMLLWCRRWNEA